ncbi:MAG: hypothetical protein LBQ21_01775 [Clostridiales Family XIII bacterium]|jgi:hypothetical protein|nr:hypothetical protein [Clostridiales Family XIII bacterium]
MTKIHSWTGKEIESALGKLNFAAGHEFHVYRKLKDAIRAQNAAELLDEELENVAAGVHEEETPFPRDER